MDAGSERVDGVGAYFGIQFDSGGSNAFIGGDCSSYTNFFAGVAFLGDVNTLGVAQTHNDQPGNQCTYDCPDNGPAEKATSFRPSFITHIVEAIWAFPLITVASK
ncbi:MAG: hypothetical protein VX558_12965 [Actinomycetota bacterium]|nr:hypothetical protein [Actinomycetota bacterium]